MSSGFRHFLLDYHANPCVRRVHTSKNFISAPSVVLFFDPIYNVRFFVVLPVGAKRNLNMM